MAWITIQNYSWSDGKAFPPLWRVQARYGILDQHITHLLAFVVSYEKGSESLVLLLVI